MLVLVNLQDNTGDGFVQAFHQIGVGQYEAALQAAQQQLSAAQVAGDPEKIRQANSAVTEAQTALNNARAALAETQTQIYQCNDALTLAQTNWYAAGQAITQSQAAIATIGREIKVAESAFKASTAGIPLYLILCHRCQLKTNPSDFFMMTLLYSSRNHKFNC